MTINTPVRKRSEREKFTSYFVQVILCLTALLCFIYLVDGVANQSNLFTNKTGLQTDGKTLVTAFFSFLAALTSGWSVITSRQSAARIEELKYQNAREIEDLKQQLTTQFPALKESRSAALNYYRVLSSIVDTASLDSNSLKQCEKFMLNAEGNVYFLSDEYKENWYGFWQAADTISKRIAQETDLSAAKEKWNREWSESLANKLESLAEYKPTSAIVTV